MPRQVYVITEQRETAESIERYFRLTRGVRVSTLYTSAGVRTEQWVLRTFRQIADWLESAAGDFDLRSTLAFIDFYDERLDGFDQLDPLSRGEAATARGMTTVVAMLVLTFPEIHWVFNSPYEPLDNELFRRGHLLGGGRDISDVVELHEAKYTPLFDPTGLRNVIRSRVRERATDKSKYVPVRRRLAAAIDEEESYAYFNAYLAYRLGYRTHLISSFAMLDLVLSRMHHPNSGQGDRQNPAAGGGGRGRAAPAATGAPTPNGNAAEPDPAPPLCAGEPVELIFEDLYLNFPDQPEVLTFVPREESDPTTWRLSQLRWRTKRFKGLANRTRQYRVLVTVGHERTTNQDDKKANDAFMEEWKQASNTRGYKQVSKPLAGFFYLWDESGYKLWRGGDGLAKGYRWPPIEEEPSRREKLKRTMSQLRAGWREVGQKRWRERPGLLRERLEQPDETQVTAQEFKLLGHSAPGRLLEITSRLLQRAKRISDQASNVPEAVYGAVIALEAQEYLGHRTPTTSIEALALKHKLEVSAECMFHGVVHQKEEGLRLRMREIAREVKSISNWLDPKGIRQARADAQISIIGELVLKFRDHYQFDEEQECLSELRILHRELWLQRRLSKWEAFLDPTSLLFFVPCAQKRARALFLRVRRWIASASSFLILKLILLPRYYVEALVNSVWLFLMCIFLWLAIFSSAFTVVCNQCEVEATAAMQGQQQQASKGGAGDAGLADKGDTGGGVVFTHLPLEHGVSHAVTSFFGLQPPHNPEQLERYGDGPFFLSIAAIVIGFVHLGIFVSHLYTLISRR